MDGETEIGAVQMGQEKRGGLPSRNARDLRCDSKGVGKEKDKIKLSSCRETAEG